MIACDQKPMRLLQLFAGSQRMFANHGRADWYPIDEHSAVLRFEDISRMYAEMLQHVPVGLLRELKRTAHLAAFDSLGARSFELTLAWSD